MSGKGSKRRSDSLLPPRLPLLLLLSLFNLYKCAAKRKAQAKRATRCAAEKRKACVNKNTRSKPYHYYYSDIPTLS